MVVFVTSLGNGRSVWGCPNCPWWTEAATGDRVEHECGKGHTVSPGLGDKIAEALASWGVTQESWIAFKEQHGLPPECECESRKQWLNQFGELVPSAIKYSAVKTIEALTRRKE